MNQVVEYEFVIRAVSPVYFGDGEVGRGLGIHNQQTSERVLFGNAIGGALRHYLMQTNISRDLIYRYMGGSKEEQQATQLINSILYISDGIIQATHTLTKEGTAIDAEYGTAKPHMLYAFDYFPAGTRITFRITCEDWVKWEGNERYELDPDTFEHLIGTWAHGFVTHQLRLGGQKNNGFGAFALEQLRKKQVQFRNRLDVDQYIFDFDHVPFQTVDWQQLRRSEIERNHKIHFRMAGYFPYGVYQNYSVPNQGSDFHLTGIQQRNRWGTEEAEYYLPSTSLKGLLRHELFLLLRRITGDAVLAEEKCCELFGDTNRKGKLIVEDIPIQEAREVKISRIADGTTDPVYIKIDRLTGSVLGHAMKHQREIQGKATLLIELDISQVDQDAVNAYQFVFIYILRRIGQGLVPLGGRTSIGLGQFMASQVNVALRDHSFDIGIDQLNDDHKVKLNSFYESLTRWCQGESTTAISY